MRKKSKKTAVDKNPERGAWMAQLRERVAESQAVFGERFNVTQTTVSRWEEGYPPAKRYWNSLAQLAGVGPEFFLQEAWNGLRSGAVSYNGNTGPNKLRAPTATQQIPVQSRIGGGQWVEVQDFDEAPMEYVDAPQDRLFPTARHMAFLVDGDSMDQAGIQDGFYVSCVDFIDASVHLQTGMIVVVEERRDGGHLIRRAVKEVHVFRDHYELRPCSSNPVHKKIELPITYFDEPKEEVRVIAIVIGAYKPINPFKPLR